jgi:hypothetical protein
MDTDSLWSITPVMDLYTDLGSGRALLFTNFDNLTGGSGNDTFDFSPGASVRGNVDGGAGTNILSFNPIAAQIVHILGPGTLTGFNGVAPGAIGRFFLNINAFPGAIVI